MKRKSNNPGRMSKEKGAEFEGKVCKVLTSWWQRGTFVRTKNMQVVGHSDRLVHGDVACLLHTAPPSIDSAFPFSVECKKEEGWDFTQLVRGNGSNIFATWWAQSLGDSERWNKVPLVVFSRNFTADFVMYHTDMGERLEGSPLTQVREPLHGARFKWGTSHMHIALLSEFLLSFSRNFEES